MKKYLFVALPCLLAACSPGVSGVYTDSMGVTRYHFAAAGTVRIEAMGIAQETTYVRDRDTLRVALPQKAHALEFTIGADGALTGPLGIRLEKADR
ncbi:hypothetical protein [Stenotrophomonas mori]|uniref:Lipoprotein n=1 Tax=Stenotrophomonas mori TaxID=2871096 RepID=A0ABT0SD77_9GAMM|nr:hypothetical protein [Stenotrophomonas mori]MCL7713274.1 hypothetical protein [Stenotrophomonas mori]